LTFGEKRYNAKLLLFGEYSILHGSKAFSFPLASYSANWAKKDVPEGLLAAFIDHATETLGDVLDIKRMRDEHAQGLYLDSNIPYGYGLGSSGSLVAAFLDRYLYSKEDSLQSLKLKTAKLESFFHGKSSGTDPLISYFNYPLVFHDDGNIELVSRELSIDPFHIYLLDSGVKRETSVLVKQYLAKYETDSSFRDNMNNMAMLNDSIINKALDASAPDLMQELNTLSALQYAHMQDMILDSINPHWKTSLAQDTYAFKLCGAGGGGFYLVIAQTALASDLFQGFELIKLML